MGIGIILHVLLPVRDRSCGAAFARLELQTALVVVDKHRAVMCMALTSTMPPERRSRSSLDLGVMLMNLRENVEPGFFAMFHFYRQ
jgi:hypothetical protein